MQDNFAAGIKNQDIFDPVGQIKTGCNFQVFSLIPRRNDFDHRLRNYGQRNLLLRFWWLSAINRDVRALERSIWKSHHV